MASAPVFLPPIGRFQWLLYIFLPPFGTRKASSYLRQSNVVAIPKGSDRLKVKTIPLTFIGRAGAYAACQQQCSTITSVSKTRHTDTSRQLAAAIDQNLKLKKHEYIQSSGVSCEQIGGVQPVWHVAVHGHYADAGVGKSREEINTTYKNHAAEELPLDASEIVITSTTQEIEEQWHLYDGFDPVLERKLRARIKRVAYPKHHKQYEVPDIYGLAAKTKGVFINPAFIEPFGLTVIEAAAYDLPIVATKNGVLLTFISGGESYDPSTSSEGRDDLRKTLDPELVINIHVSTQHSTALFSIRIQPQDAMLSIVVFAWECRDKPSTKQSIFVHNKATLYNMSFHLVPKTEATLKNMPFHLTVPTSFKLKV
ncbi:hypothetical protein V6N12_067323 [Hibiscus sabdariffa]|uniref:Sucrose-phosphate synthase n=1 Tax=Hibiscus sabdariffa TaxID=183260 RepID=A0ABR2BDZ8_9ROSI